MKAASLAAIADLSHEQRPCGGSAAPLQSALEHQGEWLFRRRSYLPLPLFVLLLAHQYVQAVDQPQVVGREWLGLCLLVGGLGVCIRIGVGGYAPAGTSGRSTRRPVASMLNTTGPYSIVRHPLYVGNLLMWSAAPLFTGSLVWTLVTVAAFVLAYERIIMAEERFLRERFGEAFDRWAEITSAVVPRSLRWRRPALPFSLRTAAAKEYPGVFGLVAALTALHLARRLGLHGDLVLDGPLSVLFPATAVLYVLVRALKRHTTLLRAPER